MSNLELMRKRLEFQGGIAQEDRMIKGKYNTFLKALKYSYQACDVQLIQHWNKCYEDDYDPNSALIRNNPICRALINPDKTKQDYDDKILSIDYNHGFGPGDVFRWVIRNKRIIDGVEIESDDDRYTSWLIYLPALNEDAYFRSEIRICRYIIKFKDEQGKTKYTWAAIRGPVETQIDSIQKNQIRLDVPNLTLNILLPRNDDTLPIFDRYTRFLFAGRAWKVSTSDSISMRNIIEITAIEDYINEDKDDQEHEIVDGLIIETVDPNPPNKDSILGETFIMPNTRQIYEVSHSGGTWNVKTKNGECPPVYVEPIDERHVAITWRKVVSGEFILAWSNQHVTLEKTIIVESLF